MSRRLAAHLLHTSPHDFPPKYTHVVLIANVDVGDLDLQVFDDLSDELLHERVLLLQSRILCETQTNTIHMMRPDRVQRLSEASVTAMT